MNKMIAKLLMGVLFVLGAAVANGQASNYSYFASSGASLETITTPVVLTTVSTGTLDDGSNVVSPAGFTFPYNGTNYTQFTVVTNGWLRFGNFTNTDIPTSLTSIGSVNAVFTFGRDGNMNTGNGGSMTHGPAAGDKYVFHFVKMSGAGSGGASATIYADQQIVLWGSTSATPGKIEIIYGTSAGTVGSNGTIGIVDAANTYFNGFTGVNSNTTTASAWPASGQKYEFTPPPPCVAPTSLPASVTATPGVVTIAGSFTAAPPTAPTGYLVVRTPTNVQPTPVAGTTYTVGTNAIGYIEYVNTAAGSWTSTGLTALTTYYYWVFSYNNTACAGGPLYSATATTTSTTTTTCSIAGGTYDVGPGAVSGYLTLKAAVDAVVLNGVTGPVIFELNAAYASGTDAVFPIVLGNVPCASATNTITIRPAAGAGAKTITSANTTATLDINGGNYWIIDGRQGGVGASKDLTIANTSTSVTGGTIRLINDAHHNTITYCNVTGVATTTTTGNILFSTTTGSLGNSDNTVSNCSISDGATTPANGIYSSGTATFLNNNNTITNNNIFNFYNSTSTSNGGVGVNLSTNNSNWTISNNSFYQTATRTTFGGGATFNGILISSSTVNGTSITGNFIGGTAPNCGSTAMTLNTTATLIFRGIQVTAGTTTATSIQGNTIQNIAITTASTSTAQSLISAVSGNINIGNVTPNTLGSQSVTGSVTFVQSTTSTAVIFSGILAGTGTPGVINISNNTIGGIAASNSSTGTLSLRGISVQGAATSYTISGNTIGSAATANSITNATNSSLFGIFSASTAATNTTSGNTIANMSSTSTGTSAQVFGILLQGSSGGAFTTTGNTVRNLTSSASNTGTTSSASIIGISHTAATTVGQTVSQNTVYALSNTHPTAATAITGIHYAGPTSGTNSVARNLVYNLNLATTSATADMRGINFASGLATIQNNMIRLGYNATGAAAITNGIPITGLYEAVSTTNSAIYFNSVYIGGTGVGVQTGNTYAFRTDQTTNARIFQNNIFVNARSNAAAGGKHYAVRAAGTAPNPAGLNLNYNDYFISGSGGVFGFFNGADVATLAAWRTAVGQDAQSLNVDPLYLAATAATPDLHITSGTTTLESAALSIAGITNDFDNDTRPGAPSGSNSGVGADIGADEFNGINPAVCSGTPAAGGTATSSVSIICSGSNVNFTVTGATAGVGIQYQWQSSPAGLNTWTDVAGATSTTSSIPVTGNTDFRCKVICAVSTLFTTSTVVTVNGSSCQFNIVKSAATFTSISGTGTSMSGWRASATNTDDNLSTSQPIGFSFPYKGTSYTNFSVSTNGFLTFNVGTSATGTLTGAYGYSNTQFSTTGGTVTSLAPFYEDQVTPGNPGTAAGLAAAMKYQVDGSAPNRVLTVEWIGMETFGNAGPNLNYQVKIYETTGVVEYVYGTMEGFNGTADYGYTYSMGVNGATISATPTVLQLQTQQIENVQNFSAVPANSLSRVPDCNIKYTFTPNTYGTADPAPGVPANDEPGATATTLSVNASPCVSLCGTYYTSKNATASAGITVCSAGTPGTPDDDVWFKFVATATDHTITVRGAGGYDAVVQLFSDAGTTPITCVNATAVGFTETINATGLTPASTYYVRVYHAAAGSGTNGDFSICVNEVLAAPANDNICGAVTLTAGLTCSPVSGTTIAATASPQAVCGGTADDDVWYKWTAVLATDSIKVQSAAGFNAHVEIFSSSDNTCTGTLTTLSCINVTSTGGLEVYAPTGLIPGNTYFVRVYHSASGTGTGSFTICALAPPPACVTGTTPANALSVDAATGTTLGWSAAAGATGYDVYFDTNNPPTTLVSSNQAGLTYATGVLTVNQVYYWRIISRNAAGTSSGCSVQNINTNPPACIPAPTSPVNAANICASATATTLSWPASPGATGYDVYFNLGAGPAATLVSSNQAGLTFNAGVLAAGAYVWRIEPRNNNGVNTGCNNWTFTVIAAPTINITPAGPVSICAPATQTLTLGSTSASTPTYQWKNGGVNIPAETGTSYTASASGSYSLQVTDGVTGCISVSNAVIVTVSTAPVISGVTASPATICSGGTATLTATVAPAATYCTAQSTVDCLNDDEYISNVTFSTINNSSTCAASATGYTDYTAISTAVTPGSYTMSVTNGNGYTGDQCKAWIDLNRNGLFTDPGEEFTSTGGPTSFSIAVTIPGTAYNGPTRMRVRVTYTTGMAPCGTSGFGETEDYTVNISGATEQYTYLWSPATFLSSTTTNPTNVTGATATTIYNVQVISGACNANANVTLTVGNTWIGTSADAATAGNWTCGLPDGTTDIIIPTTPSGGNMPLLSGPLAVRSVNLQPSAVLALGAQTLTINGAVTGSGTLSGSATSGLVITGAAGTINFTSGSRILKDLSLSAGATATLGTPLDITAGATAGVVTVASAATLTTGGNLTLKSDAAGTARVGSSAGTISGNATVERYLANPQRAWHLLSAQAVTGAQTMYDAWQEGGAVNANKGTLITSNLYTVSNGFDLTSNSASVLTHIQNNGSGVAAWDYNYAATNNALTPLSAKQGYMLFVRGDRTCTPSNATVTATVLKATGTLTQGPVSVAVSSNGSGNTLVGNPYASAIDMENILAPGGTNVTNLDQNFMIWDPSLQGSKNVGGYRAVVRTGINTYNQTPVVLGGPATPSADVQFIHSGSAFFMHATGGDVNLAFTEASKATTPTTVYNPIVATKGDQQLLANLMTVEPGGAESLADGIRVMYNDSYKATTADDILKMGNFSENLSSYRDGKKLIVERRPMIGAKDTIYLRMTNTGIKNYRFQVGTVDFVQTGVTAYLEDMYKGTKTTLDLDGAVNNIDFSITADPASANQDRFRIVFAAAPQPQTQISLTAAAQGNAIAVEWKAGNQYNMKQYEVERSTDGINYTKLNTQAAMGTNGSDAVYRWLDVDPVMGSLQQPVDNFYRIRSVDLNAAVKIAGPVSVKMGKGDAAITIYPNPVTGHRVSLKFTGMQKGTYQVMLFNTTGQLVFTKKVAHSGGTATQTLVFDNGIAKGMYRLQVTKPDNSKTMQTIIIAE